MKQIQSTKKMKKMIKVSRSFKKFDIKFKHTLKGRALDNANEYPVRSKNDLYFIFAMAVSIGIFGTVT